MKQPQDNATGFMSDETSGRTLSINKDFYERTLKAVVESQFKPGYCINFSVILPFQMPLNKGTTFQLAFRDKATVFYFNKFGNMMSQPIYEHDDGFKNASVRTRVEMACFTNEDLSQIDSKRIFEYLIHLTNRFNCYVYSYRMLFDDIFTYSLGQGSLPTAVFYEISKLPEWVTTKAKSLPVNTNMDCILGNLPNDMVSTVECLGAYIATSNNPFLPSRKFFAEARRYLWLSNYREAIIYLQMTVESLLDNILRLCLIQNGKSEPDVDLWMLETPFATRFKKWIPQYIGGDWDYTKPNGVVSNWFKNVYQARNRILHGGFEPSIVDAKTAFESVFVLSRYVDDLLNKRRQDLSSVWGLRNKVPELFLRGVELPRTTNIE